MRIRDINFDRNKQYDVAIGVCGYEPRSSYVARIHVDAQHRIAMVYPDTQGGSFDENRQFFDEQDWRLVAEDGFVATLSGIFNESTAPSVLVDISSMARRTMAQLVQLLWEHPKVGEVDFIYAPPRYESSVAAAHVVPSLNAGPLSNYFAGEVRPPSIPIALVLGLGLEPHRASGLIELIEPNRLWAFAATSDDQRFMHDLRTMYEDLLVDSPDKMMLWYDIHSISGVYNSLDSLVFASSLNYRLLIAPSGPKIFTLAALLVGAPRIAGRPALWRVGSSANVAAQSAVIEAGEIVGASVDLSSEMGDELFRSSVDLAEGRS